MRRGTARSGALLAGALLVLLAVLLAGALGGWLVAVAVAGLALAACEVALHPVLASVLPRQLHVALGELYARLALEQALLLVFLVREPQLGGTAKAVVVVSVVAYQLLRTAHSLAGFAATRLAVPRARLRLSGTSQPQPSVDRLVGPRALQVLVAATGLPALGLLWAAVTGSFALVAPAAVVMVLVAGAVLAAGAPVLLTLLRRSRGGGGLPAAREAVAQHRPSVVLYSNGSANDLHWVTPWLDTLDELAARGRPGLVMTRKPEVLDLLPPSATPVLCLPDPRDVVGFPLPDARVALYVANSPENARLLRNPQLRSAFVGHGDSDKAASASPLAKMYDEVWVAGEAGRARYVDAHVGVRPDRIRVVGRPQVRTIRPAAPREPGALCSVLYAPTWEGFLSDASESSLLHSGRELVRVLLATEGVRVLYRPHPNTGFRDRRFREAHEDVLAALAAAGQPHAAVEARTMDVPAAFNTADVLLTDVSSVISDFLASGKPYLVVNGTDLSAPEFRERFPSTAGAGIVGTGAEGLTAALADACGPDTMRAAREQVRLELLGPPTDDPVGVFADAIDALGHRTD